MHLSFDKLFGVLQAKCNRHLQAVDEEPAMPQKTKANQIPASGFAIKAQNTGLQSPG